MPGLLCLVSWCCPKWRAALLESLAAWPACVTSELASVEVVRAARRASTDPAVEQRAGEVLAGLHLLKIDSDILARAARLEPRTLRSLDAIHLAAALSLGDDLGAVAIYDTSLATAAAAAGWRSLCPGLLRQGTGSAPEEESAPEGE